MHYAIHILMTCDIVIAIYLLSINYSFITKKNIVVYWLAITLPLRHRSLIYSKKNLDLSLYISKHSLIEF